MYLAKEPVLKSQISHFCPNVQGFLDLGVDLSLGQSIGWGVLGDLVGQLFRLPSGTWRRFRYIRYLCQGKLHLNEQFSVVFWGISMFENHLLCTYFKWGYWQMVAIYQALQENLRQWSVSVNKNMRWAIIHCLLETYWYLSPHNLLSAASNHWDYSLVADRLWFWDCSVLSGLKIYESRLKSTTKEKSE